MSKNIPNLNDIITDECSKIFNWLIDNKVLVFTRKGDYKITGNISDINWDELKELNIHDNDIALYKTVLETLNSSGTKEFKLRTFCSNAYKIKKKQDKPSNQATSTEERSSNQITATNASDNKTQFAPVGIIANEVLKQIMSKLKIMQDEKQKDAVKAIEAVADTVQTYDESAGNEIRKILTASSENTSMPASSYSSEIETIIENSEVPPEVQEKVQAEVQQIILKQKQIDEFMFGFKLELFVLNNVLFLNNVKISSVPYTDVDDENNYIGYEFLNTEKFENMINTQLNDIQTKYSEAYFNHVYNDQSESVPTKILRITERLLVKKDDNDKLKLHVYVIVAEDDAKNENITTSVEINDRNAENIIQQKVNNAFEKPENMHQIYESLMEAYNNSQSNGLHGGYKKSNKRKTNKKHHKKTVKRNLKKNKKTNKQNHRKTRR
jgi:hypothetical protein